MTADYEFVNGPGGALSPACPICTGGMHFRDRDGDGPIEGFWECSNCVAMAAQPQPQPERPRLFRRAMEKITRPRRR